jgi:glucokinase
VEMVREIGTSLGVGIASIVNAFNPCILVLGGGVIEGMPELVPIAEAVARERALAAAARSLIVRQAALHGFAGTIGAAAWARRR